MNASYAVSSGMLIGEQRRLAGTASDRKVGVQHGVTPLEVVVAITNGKLDFGPWEQIFYGEFDARRDKRVMVKIIGE